MSIIQPAYFAIKQIMKSLDKKNIKNISAEINHIFKITGSKGHIFYISLLLEEILTQDLPQGGPLVSLLLYELNSDSIFDDAGNILFESIKSVSDKLKNSIFSDKFLYSFCDTLQLTSPHQIMIGLAFFNSTIPEIKKNGQEYLINIIPTITEGVVNALNQSVLQSLVHLLSDNENQEFNLPKYKEILSLILEITKDRKLILPFDIFNNNVDCSDLSNLSSSNNLCDLFNSLGYIATFNFNILLKCFQYCGYDDLHYPPEREISKLLLLFGSTMKDLISENDSLLSIIIQDGSENSTKISSSSCSEWNIVVLTNFFTKYFPNIYWEKVVEQFDIPNSELPNIKISPDGLHLILEVCQSCLQGSIPINPLLKKWENLDLQYQIYTLLITNQYSLLEFPKIKDQKISNPLLNKAFMETYLSFTVTPYFQEMSKILESKCCEYPDIFLVQLLSCECPNNEFYLKLIFKCLDTIMLDSFNGQAPTQEISENQKIKSDFFYILLSYFKLDTKYSTNDTPNSIRFKEFLKSYPCPEALIPLRDQLSKLNKQERVNFIRANDTFQKLFNGVISVSDTIQLLINCKNSADPNEKSFGEFMITSFLGEFNNFNGYSHTVIAPFLSQLINNELFTVEQIRYTLDNLKKWGMNRSINNNTMVNFALTVVDQSLPVLMKKPDFLSSFFRVPQTMNTPVFDKYKLLVSQQANLYKGISRVDTTSFQPQGIIQYAIPSVQPTQPQVQIQIPPTSTPPVSKSIPTVTSCTRPITSLTNFSSCFRETVISDRICEPDEITKKKIYNTFNNITQQTINDHTLFLSSIDSKYYVWLSNFLITEYFVNQYDKISLYYTVLYRVSESFVKICYNLILNKMNDIIQSNQIDQKYRQHLRNLSKFVKKHTINRNVPILYNDINLKELIFVGYENGRVFLVLDILFELFNKISRNILINERNIWIKRILSVLKEISEIPGLDENIKTKFSLLFSKKLETKSNEFNYNSIAKSTELYKLWKPKNLSNDYSANVKVSDLPGFTLPVKDTPVTPIPNQSTDGSPEGISIISKYIVMPPNETVVKPAIIAQQLLAVLKILITRCDDYVQTAIITVKELLIKDCHQNDKNRVMEIAKRMVMSYSGGLVMVNTKNTFVNLFKQKLIDVLKERATEEILNFYVNNNFELGLLILEKYVAEKSLLGIADGFQETITNLPPLQNCPQNHPTHSHPGFYQNEEGLRLYYGLSSRINFCSLPSVSSDIITTASLKKHAKDCYVQWTNEIYTYNNTFKSLENIKPYIHSKSEKEMSSFFYHMTSDAFERFKAENRKGYQPFDSLAKLFSHIYLSVNPPPITAMFSGIIRHLLDTADLAMARSLDWDQRYYYRILVSIFQELLVYRQISDNLVIIFIKEYNAVLQVIQPKRVPLFAFSWLDLISYRFYLPKLKYGNSDQTPIIEKHLVAAFDFLDPFLTSKTFPDPAKIFYKGLLRVLLVLLHDFPQILCSYHMSLINHIPLKCVQLKNIISSAFPREMQLPDPFAQDILSNAILWQKPDIQYDYTQLLTEAKIIIDLDNFLINYSPTSFINQLVDIFKTTTGEMYNIPLMNDFVMYVAMKAISSGDDSTDKPNKIVTSLLKDVLKRLDSKGRYIILGGIVNHIRYPNLHTRYFSILLFNLFETITDSEETVGQIPRILFERLIVHRPHPWGLIVILSDLMNNDKHGFKRHNFHELHPEIDKLIESVSKIWSSSKNNHK